MKQHYLNGITLILTSALGIHSATAAISLDRTRVIFNGEDKSMVLNVTNNNKKLPYLAQAWVENEKGEKVNGPIIPLPPMQRVEPGKSTQVKLQGQAAMAQLPQDRESVFYFNLREIPPRTDKPNTLQVALQTRVKLFYRPKAIAVPANSPAFQEKLTLRRQGNHYTVVNPTPYYITLAAAGRGIGQPASKDFSPMMVAPKSELTLGATASTLGDNPVLTYIDDYGGRPLLKFTCSSSTCTAKVVRG